MKQLYDVSVPINILNQTSQVFLFSHESFSSLLQISVANNLPYSNRMPNNRRAAALLPLNALLLAV